ncbi:MAG: GNAT family N-acetyltransferase [Chloroherpetonaceae bacterium]|nr:GNAT family N-acetyltransferase [Chthonomonadaceae bacterium]MDW8206853.1 GNAT family N-acetyltransferase [Chloroherpetonaceae bacterium]
MPVPLQERIPYFPEHVETPRLILRPATPEDCQELNAALHETWPDLQTWMDWADRLPSVAETALFLQRAAAAYHAGRDCMLVACHRSTRELVLCTGLHPRDRRVPKFEIGYWCRARYQRQGYVTEAVQAVTRAGFEHAGARRIEIRCDSRNVRSRRVAEQAGYHLEAILRHDRRAPDGSLRDTLLFVLLSEEFFARPPK